MDVIRKTIYNILSEYTTKSILDKDKFFKDLSIYGDDFEEFIFSLSEKLEFDIYDFFVLFEKKCFYNPPEIYLKLPKIFYIDLKNILFGKIIFHKIENKGKDIDISSLVILIENLIKP